MIDFTEEKKKEIKEQISKLNYAKLEQLIKLVFSTKYEKYHKTIIKYNAENFYLIPLFRETLGVTTIEFFLVNMITKNRDVNELHFVKRCNKVVEGYKMATMNKGIIEKLKFKNLHELLLFMNEDIITDKEYTRLSQLSMEKKPLISTEFSQENLLRFTKE